MSEKQLASVASEADAVSLVADLDSAAGYPRKGVGGSLVQVESWDGTGECPPGWTATAAEVVIEKDGTATVRAKTEDVAALDARPVKGGKVSRVAAFAPVSDALLVDEAVL